MLNDQPQIVKIVEVGPRDGLQNENQFIALTDKRQLIHMLEDSGLSVIEVGAFVSPKWVPQMADTAELFEHLEQLEGIDYPVLVPNMKGLDLAIRYGVKDIAIFASASEEFSQKNINCSIDESLDGFRLVCKKAKRNKIRIRGYLSCVLGCPYEGEISPKQVADIARKMYQMGCYEISLGDTIGIGTPVKTQNMLAAVLKYIPKEHLAVHFHDTYGQALDNIAVALDNGIAVIDSSVAGLGGCPYAKGASGNVATEKVVYMLNNMKIETGVDLEKLSVAGQFICRKLGRDYLLSDILN